MPARLEARRVGQTGAIELLLLRPETSESRWEALARPARRLQPGTRIEVGGGGDAATVVDVRPDGRRVVEFDAGVDVRRLMAAQGHMPLPPYIDRPDTPADRERYQTVFARAEGAVAAPTAGLHFTPARLEALAAAGVTLAHVTLHVGIGTFRPVTAEDPREHAMEPEWYELPEATAAAYAACRARGGRVVACGTTVVRTLETAAGGGFGGADAAAGRATTLAAGGLDARVHLPALCLPRRRRAHHELPPAGLHAAAAGGGFGRPRAHPGRLRGGHPTRLSLLLLRRRHADPVGGCRRGAKC